MSRARQVAPSTWASTDKRFISEFVFGFNELELLEKEFDLKCLEETEEPKEKKEFFIDNQGKKQPVPSNPLKFTKKD